MRGRSFAGPLILLLVGVVFLWSNLHPETPVWDLAAQYWPFLLILWGLLRLIEAAFSRNDQWRSSFTGGEVVLIVLVCMAGLGIWQAKQLNIRFNSRGLDFFGQEFDYPVSATQAAGGVKQVAFENLRGNVRVVGGDFQQVSVTGHKSIRSYSRTNADSTNTNTPVEILQQGDRLLIRTNEDRAPSNESISDDLEVTVPRSIAVESHGNSGDYEISDIDGDVDLGNNRGDVRLMRIGGSARLEVARSETISAADVKGKIDLQGRGTDIAFENIGGPVTVSGSYTGTLEFKNLAKALQFEGVRNTELHVEAVPGRITLDRATLTASGVTGPIRFVAHSRDIKLEQFTQSADIETNVGDIELDPGKLPLSKIDARSGNGAIELALPEKAAFQLQATAERGDAENDFGPPVEVAVEGRTSTLKGKVGDGPPITLTAHHGKVSVRKQDATSDAGKSLKDTEVRM